MTTAIAPPAIDLDLISQEFKRDPIPTFARMRALGPVIRARIPLFGKVWIATTYEAVNELLRDHQRFVQNPANAGNPWMTHLFRLMPGSLKPLATNMLVRDPPDHQRLRALVEQAFRKHSVEALRPRIAQLCDEALDHLEAMAARSPRGVDFIAHFARPFPLAVICEILGLPSEDRPMFTQWASRFSTAEDLPEIIHGLFFGVRRLMSYVREEFRRQSERPREGLMTALIEAEENGDRLTEDELVAMVFLLLAAGHETTLHQIALNLLTLLDHPRVLDELKSDWSLAEPAANELLRRVSFAQISKPRYARQDTEFHGHTIRKGQMIFACLGSANHDPEAFENPEQLNIHRQPNRHSAFGTGIHVCLGAALARAETAIAIERIFTRFPNIHIAVPRADLTYSARPGTLSLLALPVRFQRTGRGVAAQPLGLA